eukprot:m.330019 g.330019  ORF g.330019 m.330019 type:complete len:145 (+) comp20455_c0_seq7:1863-2297(+)
MPMSRHTAIATASTNVAGCTTAKQCQKNHDRMAQHTTDEANEALIGYGHLVFIASSIFSLIPRCSFVSRIQRSPKKGPYQAAPRKKENTVAHAIAITSCCAGTAKLSRLVAVAAIVSWEQSQWWKNDQRAAHLLILSPALMKGT